MARLNTFHEFGSHKNDVGVVVVKNLDYDVKAHFAGIEPQDNHIHVFFVVKVLDYLEIAIERIDTKFIRNSVCT